MLVDKVLAWDSELSKIVVKTGTEPKGNLLVPPKRVDINIIYVMYIHSVVDASKLLSHAP